MKKLFGESLKNAIAFMKRLSASRKTNCHLCGICRGLCAWTKSGKPLDTREE